jgi:hypothetical protein
MACGNFTILQMRSFLDKSHNLATKLRNTDVSQALQRPTHDRPFFIPVHVNETGLPEAASLGLRSLRPSPSDIRSPSGKPEA